MMKNTVAFVLAGGRTGSYGVLTLNRAKGALTFGGHYRIIDFALSNLRNSGLEQVGIVIQYLPSSLIDHVGVGQPWDFQGYGRVCRIMPPFVGINETAWYKGTADALYQNINLVRDLQAEHVIVLSGEHVYSLDFREVLRFHMDSDSDLTIVVKDVPPEMRNPAFGYAIMGDGTRVSRFVEKPRVVPEGAGVSLGIYVFKAPVLARLLAENAESDSHNLARDVIEPHASSLISNAFWTDAPWDYLPNARAYHAAHSLYCLGERGFRDWGIITNLEYRGAGSMPPPRIGRRAAVRDAALSSGCLIEGQVEGSVLSPGVVVAEGAQVRNSILMHQCRVEAGAVLEGVISDKDAVFGHDSRVGVDTSALPADDRVSSEFGELVVIGKGVVVGDGVRLPRRVQATPGARMLDQGAVDSELLSLSEQFVPSRSASPYLMRGRA